MAPLAPSKWTTAGRWPSCCAITWGSPAPRSAAIAANAALARCTSTASRCTHAANWPRGWTDVRFRRSRGSRKRQARSAAAIVHGSRRAAVRLLHFGPVDGAKAVLNAIRMRPRRRCARRHDRQHLPLLELQPLRRSDSRGCWQSQHAIRRPSSIDNAAGQNVQSLQDPRPPTPRIDALERVTGKATYTGDVSLPPGMLYARVLRSPHPHARIRSDRYFEGVWRCPA